MMGVKALRKIQLGRETTAGTAVSASTIWRGEGMIEDLRETIFVEEDIGYLSGVDRTVVTKYEAHLTMEEAPATFEQILHIFDASINVDTATQDGSGAGYVHDFVFPTTAANTIKCYTIEGGDDAGGENFAYGFVEGWTLSGEPGDVLKISADWVGRQVAPITMTDTASVPDVEEIPFTMGKLYIDNDTVTMGTTQKTNTWLGFNLDVDPGWQAVFSGDGALYFTFIKQTRPEIKLEITFEHDATAIAEIAAWRAQTARKIRMVWEGSSFTAGNSYSKKTLQIDLAGKWEKFDKVDEQDGNDVVTGTFIPRYNSDGSLFAQIRVVNKVSAMP